MWSREQSLARLMQLREREAKLIERESSGKIISMRQIEAYIIEATLVRVEIEFISRRLENNYPHERRSQ